MQIKVKFPLFPGHDPKFKPNDEVWIIRGPNEIIATSVLGVRFELVNYAKDRQFLFHKRYTLSIFRNDKNFFDKNYSPYKAYKSDQKALEDYLWIPPVHIEDGWTQGVGSPNVDYCKDESKFGYRYNDKPHIRGYLLKCKDRDGLINSNVKFLKEALEEINDLEKIQLANIRYLIKFTLS